MTAHDDCRVSPFGHPRITARLTAPRGLSRPPTSFIGSWCQGIHRAPLTTCPSDTRVHCSVLKPRPVPRTRHTRIRHRPSTPEEHHHSPRTQQRAQPSKPPPHHPHPRKSRTSTTAAHHTNQPTFHPRATGRDTRPHRQTLLRKEVIQPHLPVRLPCYDFVPIASPTFDSSLPQGVGPPASGVTDFRDVTGGVYKARERIHRSTADLRLLATPTSWGRVADPNPN